MLHRLSQTEASIPFSVCLFFGGGGDRNADLTPRVIKLKVMERGMQLDSISWSWISFFSYYTIHCDGLLINLSISSSLLFGILSHSQITNEYYRVIMDITETTNYD